MKRLALFIFLFTVTILLENSFEAPTATANKVINASEDEREVIPPVEQLAQSFMEHLIQTTDEFYRVENYDTKEEFVHSFAKITNSGLARRFIDVYYYEENGNLYVIPTELPPWFVSENEYELLKVREGNYRMTQKNTSELYGEYTINIDYKFKNGDWHIENVTYD